jgi:hypothetical protein
MNDAWRTSLSARNRFTDCAWSSHFWRTAAHWSSQVGSISKAVLQINHRDETGIHLSLTTDS